MRCGQEFGDLARLSFSPTLFDLVALSSLRTAVTLTQTYAEASNRVQSVHCVFCIVVRVSAKVA